MVTLERSFSPWAVRAAVVGACALDWRDSRGGWLVSLVSEGASVPLERADSGFGKLFAEDAAAADGAEAGFLAKKENKFFCPLTGAAELFDLAIIKYEATRILLQFLVALRAIGIDTGEKCCEDFDHSVKKKGADYFYGSVVSL
jgi:hypothetical protein